MHELSVTKDILNIVLKYAEMNGVNEVTKITLEIGELNDMVEEWLQRYFDMMSKGSVAEGAILEVSRVPVMIHCESCNADFPIDLQSEDEMKCPECGSDNLRVISGAEYTVKSMEVI
jgi:hydrogenase nickel incorporation protein HypA/HybF